MSVLNAHTFTLKMLKKHIFATLNPVSTQPIQIEHWKQMAYLSFVFSGVINFLKFLTRQRLLYWLKIWQGVALFAKAWACICSVAVSAQLGHTGPGPDSAQTHANIFAKIMSPNPRPNVIILLKVFERRRGGQSVNVKFVRGFHLFSIWIIVILLSSLNFCHH